MFIATALERYARVRVSDNFGQPNCVTLHENGKQAIYGFADNQLAIAASGLLLRSDALDRVPVTEVAIPYLCGVGAAVAGRLSAVPLTVTSARWPA